MAVKIIGENIVTKQLENSNSKESILKKLSDYDLSEITDRFGRR